MTLNQARNNLIDLLQRWKSGAIEDPWHVQDDAESIENKLIESGQFRTGKEKEGEAAQVDNILGQLTNAQQQHVLPEDIDVMLSLLNACDSDVAAALVLHDTYWDTLDYQSREAEVKKYWFGE